MVRTRATSCVLLTRDIVVIGASAGGIAAITTILKGLPRDLVAARDGEIFRNGEVYVASPDRHLILEASGRMRTTRAPREKRARPAIDPLFRSAALAFGPRVIGIVLSGRLDHGTAGLRGIKMCGGVTILQDPLMHLSTQCR